MTEETGRTLPLRLPESAGSVEVIVPVYNEEPILESQLVPVLSALPEGFRVSVVENGSTDRTLEVLEALSRTYGALGYVSLPEPNYGLAMRTGLDGAEGDVLIVDDLDVLDTDFWARGLRLLDEEGVGIVQGSKVLAGREDRRPLVRRAATHTLTFLLRLLLGFRGTDTHGPKVMWREAVEAIVPECGFELDLFPTELIVRAQRSGVGIREVPIRLREIRATPLPLFRRVPRALRDIWRLHRALGRP